MRAVAVIPARAGSSRVPNKNFRPVGGTHLTELAITVAQDSGIFWKVILTTDWSDGKKLAQQHGIIFHRRSKLAASNTGTATDTLDDLRETFASEGVTPEDVIFYLQPTSPLRTAQMLTTAWEKFSSSSQQGVVSVVPVDPKYSKVMTVRDDVLKSFQDEQKISSNQQQLEPLFLANGNLFAFRYGIFLERGTFPLLNLSPMVQTPSESLDIDTEEDFDQFIRKIKPRGAQQ